MYNEGISASGDVLYTGVLVGAIEKNGNTYSFGDVKLGVGKEAAKPFLKENPKVFKDADKASALEKVKAGEVASLPQVILWRWRDEGARQPKSQEVR